ncbi:DEAD/DEAH box helicase, partial [Akkermansiaceae bacterium]|nr:DEAD/DEAH box helicase [Akkermansiaceae bacterium]
MPPLPIQLNTSLAPGTRVRIRDEEWLIRSIDRTSSGIEVFGVVGLTPLVEGKEARFLRDIEEQNGEIEIIDPRLTKAVSDQSAFFRNSRLMLESHFRATTPETISLHLGHKGAMDVLPFQLEPSTLALSQPRQRILIADTVGLGKTIEAGILLSEMIKRGRGRRILVVTVKSMLTQFQKELWSRFSLPLTRLDSSGLKSVRRQIPTNHNPFHYFDKSIISIDTLKQDGEYRTHLEKAWWDIIVIDEAHNVAERGSSRGGNSLRSRTASLLASRSDSLILLSATPHDGKRESFASLMNMLNPTSIKDPKNYGPEDIDGLFIRRFKKDVKDQIAGNFPERVVHTPKSQTSALEENAYQELSNLEFKSMGLDGSGGKILFRTLLEKALFSSPAACAATINERIKRLTKKEIPEAQSDITELGRLLETVTAIIPEHFSKFQNLLALLDKTSDSSIGWNPSDEQDRLVIFTERIDTLDFLAAHLPPALKLKENQIRILHGGLGDLEQQEVVEAFGSADNPVRLLIASDVASEGINLHHQSHRLIHFDIPWSLLTFQQRNGRIDRYGQSEQPEIYYLLAESSHEQIRGDQRILELLIEKDDEVQLNIGDPSEFTGLHTAEEEETAIAQAIESDESDPEAALEKTFASSAATDDWFDSFYTKSSSETPPVESATTVSATVESPSLYQTDYHWAHEGFQTLLTNGIPITVEEDSDARQLVISVPKDLSRRLKKYPKEILQNETGLLALTTDRNAINRDIIRCRAEEGLWPRLHLLWEQHPALRWMQDKLLSQFGRNQASCIHLRHLDPGERIVLGTGIIPNRKGHPLIQRWYGVKFLDDQLMETLDLEQVIERTRFSEDHPNPPALKIDFSSVEALFDETVDCLTIHLSEARDQFRRDTEPDLTRQLDKLKSFLNARTEQVEMEFSDSIKKGLTSTKEHRRQKKEREQRQIHRQHDDYRNWITETMETEDSPSIRIYAV